MAVFPTRRQKTETPAKRPRSTVQKIRSGELTWYNFTEYSDADQRYLARNFNFHPLDFEDVASTRQRPKVDEYEDYLFIIFHVPFYDRRAKQMLQEEVDVFIGAGYLITIHSGKMKPLQGLFDEIKTRPASREQYMGKGSGFLLYELVSRLFEHSFPMLDRIAERINVAEQQILHGKSQQAMTEELSYLKLEIINFRRIIRPQRLLVTGLESKKKRFLPENLELYFDDVQDAISRTNDLLDNYKEVVESLEDTNETFITHRTNNIVKVLTLVSLITLPLSTVAAVLGMNVNFPFQTGVSAFFVSIFLSLAVVAAVYLYIFLRRWL
jgi:magnesium transporter